MLPLIRGLTAVMRTPGQALGERSRSARYCPPAHQPPPAAGRPGTAAGKGAAGPPRRSRSRVGPSRYPNAVAGARSALSLRPLLGPHPGAAAPPPLPFSAQALHPPSLFAAPPGHPAAGHPSAARLESGRATRPCSTPPDPPKGGGIR